MSGINLAGSVGELSFEVQIKRADTGQVENYTLVGYLDEQQLKDIQNGSLTLDSSSQRGN